MADKIKLEGLDQVLRNMRSLSGKAIKGAARRALRKGANIVRDAARSNARRIDDPETRENIAKNISVQGGGSRRERRIGGVMMRVGVKGGARRKSGADSLPGGDTSHFHFVELGTSNAPAQPFMRPALSQNIQSATDAITRDLAVQVAKEMAKLKG